MIEMKFNKRKDFERNDKGGGILMIIQEKKRSKEEDVSSTRQAAKLTPLRQRVGRREHRITIYKRI